MMDFLNNIVSDMNGFLWTYVIITLLVVAGFYFTFRLRFVQIRHFKEMFRLIVSSAGSKTKGNEISPFQAFCVSTASRVGVGNIAGIAIAITTGGPGAIFWMWFIAVVGAATGFVESTLGQIYKVPVTGKKGRNFLPRWPSLLSEVWFGIQCVGSPVCCTHFCYLWYDL